MKREIKSKALLSVLNDVGNTLQFMADAGCRGFECDASHHDMLRDWGGPGLDCPVSLGDIQRDLKDCRRCNLSSKRTQVVFGDGCEQARLVFVGEGPGYEEDKQGKPFVGAAGKLLNRILAAMHLSREDVYICNIVKCRPPNNRNPKPEEISTCLPFLERQIRVINPECICALGKFAAQTLLQTQTPISKLRGRFHAYHGIRVMPTYHPAYLLRNPGSKRDVWNDMQQIMQRLCL
ncbi:MAG: uracil-DNA glycosylase [Deltaproteobacteria bacterium]|nr:uracil-DNA glycosylase [Deltaproteobacteria bacterium]